MCNGMHQMGLSKSNTSVQKERIINLSRRFWYSQRSSVGKIVVSTNYKCIKSIFRIQIRLLKNTILSYIFFISIILIFHINILRIINCNKFYFKFLFSYFCNADLKRQKIFLTNIIHTWLQRHKNINRRIWYIVDF